MQLSVVLIVASAVLETWWAWLIAALLVTLIDVALLVRVIRAVNRIAALTGRTLPSAKNIATHTAALAALSDTARHAAGVLSVAGGIAQATGGIGDKLAKLDRSLRGA